MLVNSQFWSLLLGIVIFLLGMKFLEETLAALAGRPFKLFLRKHSTNVFGAIAGSSIVTAVFQSSSLINLMILAFVGSGVIKIQQALALVLGANLGTTFNSWVIATIGFEFNIESFAVPIAAVAGLATLLSRKDSKWHLLFKFFFGFGFLFVGLNEMKSGVIGMVEKFDLSTLSHSPLVALLVAGFLITSLIQSSSATVAIALTAINAGIFTLPQAMALVLGSEVGTTVKLLIAAGNHTDKRRLALGNFLFNVITAVIVFMFIVPVSRLITQVFGIQDKLIALVFFQTFVNVISILLFLPFLKQLGSFLERKYSGSNSESVYIQEADATDQAAANAALRKEMTRFVQRVIEFTMIALRTEAPEMKEGIGRKYDHLKRLHGEIQTFASRLEVADENGIVSNSAPSRLASVARNTLYSAKSIKDAFSDIEQLRNSSNDFKYQFFISSAAETNAFFEQFSKILAEHDGNTFTKLTSLYQEIIAKYSERLRYLGQKDFVKEVNQLEISTLINFNRQLFGALKSMVFALKDLLLEEDEAEYFDHLPGFIR